MKKVLDKDLEKKVGGIIVDAESPKEAASNIVTTLKELQDASGLKICQAVSKEDVAYREVK